MRLRSTSLALAAIAGLFAARAQGDIVQASGLSGGYFAGASAFGQSFVATPTVSYVSAISFKWLSANSAQSDPTITGRIRVGVGFTGSVLGTAIVNSISGSTSNDSWIDFTFSEPVALVAGQAYSLQFTRDTPGMTAGGYAYSSVDVYAGGTSLTSTGASHAETDLQFRVIGAALSAVPEASAPHFAAAALALGSCVAARCRKTVY